MPILIIRHGETALNAARVVQPPETPLSPRGLAQAERLGSRLADEPIERILCSDLPRAHQTAAAILAARADHRSVPLVTEPSLRERSFGVLCGTPYPELPPDAFSATYHPAGGESWDQFLQRAATAWQQVQTLATRCSQTLVVVTHGLVCHAWARHQLALPADTDAPAKFYNTSVTRCTARAPHRVDLLNCVQHLHASDLAPPDAIA